MIVSYRWLLKRNKFNGKLLPNLSVPNRHDLASENFLKNLRRKKSFLKNEHANSIPMTCHYPDLDGASVWLE